MWDIIVCVQLVTIIVAQANEKGNFSLPFSLSGVPEIEKFVEELTKMKKVFQGDGSQRKIVILYGLGGIGKIQLAIAFTKEETNNYSAIFWLNGKNKDTLKYSFAGMEKLLHNENTSSPLLTTAVKEKSAGQIVEAIPKGLSIRENTRWILVFDNVDKPKTR